jgi:hypothetical protein
MPRFADSKEIVANEDVEPIDEIYRKYLEEVEHRLPDPSSISKMPH